MYSPEQPLRVNNTVEVPPEPSAQLNSIEATPSESETRSPQPSATGAIGSITDGKSPVAIHYDDQPGIPVPLSSAQRHNVDSASGDKAKWATHCRQHMWKHGRKAGDPSKHHFPRGTETLPEHAIKKWVNPVLTPQELATLPCKLKTDYRGDKCKHYSIKSLLNLIYERSSELDIDIVASIRLRDEPLRGPLQLRSYDPPLKDHRTSKDPKKGDIKFDNEVLPATTTTVSIDDAAVIYSLSRDRLMALHAWNPELDIRTVAIIALELHGGFNRHNNLIVERRQNTIQKIVEHGFTEEGVHFRGPRAREFCERLLGPLPTGAGELSKSSVAIPEHHLYVKQYLPVGCIVVRDEKGFLVAQSWFHGSPSYPLDEGRDLTSI